MDTSGVSYNLIILVFLLMCSAFFSASETALFSVNKMRLRSLADNGNKKAKKTQRLLENPDDLLSTILIMNNLINITASSLTTVVMYNFFGSVGVSIATGIVTILVLIFGEITPKTVAIQNSEKIALKVINIVGFFVIILKPVVSIFKVISNSINKVNGSSNSEAVITEEELKTIVDFSEENGVLDLSEKEMIYNVFDFGDLVVKDIMVQKINITALNINSTYAETMEIIKREKYSRIPVYNEDMDSIVGILNVKDLLFNDIKEDNFKLKDYIRHTHQTYEFKKVQELFKEMKKTKSHIFIVLDEYGATKGMVTMEDMIEEIVGDIDDEYDTIEDKEIVKISEKKYIVSGATKVNDIAEQLQISMDYNSEEFDSVGGYFIKYFDGFPVINDCIKKENFKLTISEIEKKTIKKVEIEIM